MIDPEQCCFPANCPGLPACPACHCVLGVAETSRESVLGDACRLQNSAKCSSDRTVEKVPDDVAVAGGAVVVGEVGIDVEVSAVGVGVELKWQHL